MDKKLQLVFYTQNNKTYTINIDSPIDPADSLAVKDAMDTVINSNVIETTNGILTSIKEAKMVTRTVEPIVFA